MLPRATTYLLDGHDIMVPPYWPPSLVSSSGVGDSGLLGMLSGHPFLHLEGNHVYPLGCCFVYSGRGDQMADLANNTLHIVINAGPTAAQAIANDVPVGSFVAVITDSYDAAHALV